MSLQERIELVAAINASDLDQLAGFMVESEHGFLDGAEGKRGHWTVYLKPLAGRIYFLGLIIGMVDSLNMDISTYTDVNRPGYIVFN